MKSAKAANKSEKVVGKSLGKNVPVSPRRMQLVANLIRGKNVSSVLDVLKFDNRKASKYILKLLTNAVANTSVSENSTQGLLVEDVVIGQGIVLKNRGDLGPRGRFKPMKRRTTNIKIYIANDEKVNSSENK